MTEVKVSTIDAKRFIKIIKKYKNPQELTRDRYYSLEQFVVKFPGVSLAALAGLQMGASETLLDKFKPSGSFDVRQAATWYSLFGVGTYKSKLSTFGSYTENAPNFMALFLYGYLGRVSGFGGKFLAWALAVDSRARKIKATKEANGIPYGTGTNTLSKDMEDARDEIGYNSMTIDEYLSYYLGTDSDALLLGVSTYDAQYPGDEPGIDGPVTPSFLNSFMEYLVTFGYDL